MNPYPSTGGLPPQYQQHPYASNPAHQMQNSPPYYQQQYPQGQPQAQTYGNVMQHPQQPVQSNAMSCYNCGNPAHWAQDCPEPRRANPAGASQPRPAKRQKPNSGGPIITRYPPPPQPFGQNQPPPQAFGQNPPPPQTYGQNPPPPQTFGPNQPPAQAYGQNQPPPRKFSGGSGYGYPQQSGQYAPPTPSSAYGQSYYQWPQQPPQQASPQYQHGHSYAPHGLPTPSTLHGSQFSSPASGHPSAQHQGFFPPQGGSFTNTFRRPSDMSSRQNSMVSDPGSAPQYSQSAGPSAGPSRQQSYNSESSPTTASVEPWMEELEGLDIPENITGGSHINGRQLVWKPANPVAMPLPSTFSEAENIGFMPVAATLKPGSSVSKYFKDSEVESHFLNIRDSVSWKDMAGDPAFLDIAMDGDYTPFEDLIQQRNELWGLDRNMDLESEEGELPETDDYYEPSDYFQAQPEPQENGIKPHESPIGQSYVQALKPSEDDEEARAARDTEAKLAALGVTGIPKPVRAPARPFNGSGSATADEEPMMGSKGSQSQSPTELTMDKQEVEGLEETDRNQHPLNVRNGLDNQKPTHPPILEAWVEQGNDCSSNPFGKRKTVELEERENRPPPPPAPGLLRRHSQLDRDHDPVTTEVRPKQYHFFDSVESADSTNGKQAHQHNGHHESPVRRHSDRGNPRKRPFKRESSEESNEGPRRQEDDVTPKVKRRQPQVAAAYSRRW